MNLLIRDALILDPKSPYHNTKNDIHIVDGKIEKLAKDIKNGGDSTEVTGDGLMVSQGWLDMRANFYDPGEEHKEDLFSGVAAAEASGFTKLMLLPNTKPVVDQKNAVSYILERNKNQLLDLIPSAAVTRKAEGKELTEMIDLHHAGAAAFTDGQSPIWHTDIMLKALQYLQKFDGVLINRAEDTMLTAFGHMNEGAVSTGLGLKGMPELAETVMIERDLSLLRYAGGKLHVSMLSSAKSVDLVRKAKAEGLKVTCDVGVNYLKYTDDSVESYDTNYKVNPPYRKEEDRKALIAGVLDGTIDVIVSDHNPQDEESKKLEFDLADFGTNNLQSFWPIMYEVFGDKLPQVISAISSNPRSILAIDQTEILEGAEANLTLFDSSTTWKYDSKVNKSKSVYSPLFGEELKGKIVGVVAKGMFKTF